MKNDCNVVRDLMPLVIDGVASEESAQIVTEHLEGCVECERVYQGLQGELPREDAMEEQKEFEQVARKIRKHRMNRRTMVVLASVVLTVMVLIAGIAVANHLHGTYVLKDANEYDVRLLQVTGSDQVILLFTGVEGTGHGIFYDRSEEGMRFVIRSSKRKLNFPGESSEPVSFIQYMHACRLVAGHIQEEYQGTRPVLEVVLTDGEKERVVWKDGDPIPECSPEMVDYYSACGWINSALVNASEEERQELLETRQTFYDRVPEFKTK